tara:strand:+ start:882 stop:1307 length:426 start_codon:yes stop_codon:yes gene_type:complete
MKRQSKKQIKHLIYTSQPVKFDDVNISNILKSSQRNNSENGITGALIFREDLYLQFLEGPDNKVVEAYEKIKNDGRHKNVLKLKENLTDRKLFTSWAMRGDPVKTWMWSYEDVENGIVNKLTPEDALAIFARLSREVDQFS